MRTLALRLPHRLEVVAEGRNLLHRPNERAPEDRSRIPVHVGIPLSEHKEHAS